MPDTRGEAFSPYLTDRDTTTPTPNASLIREFSAASGIIPATNLASRASNAADSIVPIGTAPVDGVITGADFIPIAASQAGSATNFAIARIINLGPAGTGATVLASKTFSAAATSVASNARGSMALSSGTALSVSAGDVIGVSYASQGNGIALVSHGVSVAYRAR